MFYFPERRKRERYHIPFHIRYKIVGPDTIFKVIPGVKFESKSVDICEGGVAIITKYNIPSGTQIELTFNLNQTPFVEKRTTEDMILFRGEVIYSLSLDSERYRVGIAFQGIPTDIEDKFFDLICSPQPKK